MWGERGGGDGGGGLNRHWRPGGAAVPVGEQQQSHGSSKGLGMHCMAASSQRTDGCIQSLAQYYAGRTHGFVALVSRISTCGQYQRRWLMRMPCAMHSSHCPRD